ncbi:MAG: response regulator [Campylobacterota bacterium]|nr:response regulator [Campylobacterota bacterium]
MENVLVNILIAEDVEVNAQLLAYHVNDIFKQNSIEINFEFATDGQFALDMLKEAEFDMIFLDVLMPRVDGFKVLNKIRKSYNSNNPCICMSTSMGEKKHKMLFKLKGANSYIIKPYDKNMVSKIIDRFIEKRITNNQEIEEDEFCEFIDFFEDEDEEHEETMTQANNTAPKVTAKEYLEECGNIDYIMDSIDEADDDIEVITELLNKDTFENHRDTIAFILNKYGIFLNSFSEFYEISSAIQLLRKTIDEMDLSLYDESKAVYIAEYIKAVFIDLKDWKINVFDNQTAIDVYYINASVLSSCIQLQNLIKNK